MEMHGTMDVCGIVCESRMLQKTNEAFDESVTLGGVQHTLAKSQLSRFRFSDIL